MELLHIHQDTWAAVGATALIPFYRLTDTDIVLLDTGIAASDREGLTALLEEHGLRGAVMDAVIASYNKTKEMGKG